MAITLIERPILFITDESPGGEFYSRWNSCGRLDRINYKFNVQENDLASVLRIDLREFGSDLLLASNEYRPFKVGDFVVDVSNFVRGYLYSQYNPDLNELNSIDNGASLRFYIEYTQILENESFTFQTDKNNPVHAVHSANKIGDVNGSNLKRFVPVPTEMENKAKFLTAFESPVMFEGYPFSLSFIFDSSLGGKEIYLNSKELNINKSEIDTYSYRLDESKINRVNYLVVPNLVNSEAAYVNARLTTGNDMPIYYVDEGYVDDGYTQIL